LKSQVLSENMVAVQEFLIATMPDGL